MSLDWEGMDLQPAHGRWRFWVASGRDELPEVRTSSEVVAFRRGRIHQAGIADRRMLEVRGYIKDQTLEAFRVQHDALKGLLDPTRDEPGTLTDDFEDGTRRWVHAVPRNLLSRYAGHATRLLSIELEALDPYWYGSNGVITLDAGLLLDTGLLLDGDAPIEISPDALDYHFTFETLGTADVTDLVFEIDGPTASGGNPGFYIYNESASPGIGFRFDQELGVDETLVVDCGRRRVTRGSVVGGVNARQDLVLPWEGNRHGEYFRIHPGETRLRINGWPAAIRIRFDAVYL